MIRPWKDRAALQRSITHRQMRQVELLHAQKAAERRAALGLPEKPHPRPPVETSKPAPPAKIDEQRPPASVQEWLVAYLRERGSCPCRDVIEAGRELHGFNEAAVREAACAGVVATHNLLWQLDPRFRGI